MATLETITPAAFLPVSYGDAVEHLRLDQFDDQARIERLIRAAAKHVEETGGLTIASTAYRLHADSFLPEIPLPRPPAAGVSAVKYIDTDGALQVVDPTTYAVDVNRSPGMVRLAYGETWPAIRCEAGAVQIDYTAGYGTQDAVPEDLRLLVLFLVEHWYDDPTADVPESVERLFWALRSAPVV